MILVYDGSFGGWLTTVFEVYERKLNSVQICKDGTQANDIFLPLFHIATDAVKAKRVWKGLSQKLSSQGLDRMLYTFLSESKGIENLLMEYVRYVFSSKENIEENHGHPVVLSVNQTAKKVGREKHRMEAFVRFSQLKDGLFYSAIEPDFNVLPLVMRHFKSRYADQDWLIYDLKRKYGIHYSKETAVCSEITIDWQENPGNAAKQPGISHPEEKLYQLLWKDYFKSTGIAARKNLKLHIQHVPRRYWKYLTEKIY
jgi:probable DNA metabolism protein